MGFYVDHLQPWLLNAAMGSKGLTTVRQRVCAGLAGEVIEIGYGSGRNQPHLPAAVTGLWAVEPSATGLKLSEKRRAASTTPVVVGGADAQSLPFPDDSFDAALSTWTMCGIPDPAAALRELARVLKPGASLHFVEHGLSSEEKVQRAQRRGNCLNKAIAGCVLDLDIVSLIEGSGLRITALVTYYEQGVPKAARYTYEGRARA